MAGSYIFFQTFSLLLLCVLGSTQGVGGIDWDWLESRPKRMYEEYGGNPIKDAAEGLPRILRNPNTGASESNDSIFGFYLPYNDTSIINNTECIDSVNNFLRPFEESKIMYVLNLMKHYWPLTMTDSWGKPGDGILHGNTLLWGFQEECLDSHADENITFFWDHLYPTKPLYANFDSRYCLVHLKKNSNYSGPYIPPSGIPLDQKVLTEIVTAPDFYYYGTCFPSTCTQEDMSISIEYRFQDQDMFDFVGIDCQTEDGIGGEYTGGDIAFMVIVGLLWCEIVSATLVEFFINLAEKPELKEGILKYWLSISSYRSMSKVFRIVNKTNPDVIDCLHGLRVISMIWVTWCHSYSLFVDVTQNMKGLSVISDSVLDQIIFNGSFSVDTFFFVSGLLAVYSVLREHEITGKVNWIMYYVHRILRLMPAIALTCFFMATVARYALVGPYGPQIEKQYLQPCKDYWYMDILFASNYPNEGYKCLPQSWYTSVDTQLYFILPLVLVPLIMNKKMGLGILGLFTATSFIVPTSLFAVYNLKPYLPFAIPEIDPEEMTLDNDHMPWNRASAYFIGAWAGWLLFTYKNKKVKMPWFIVIICWCLSITISLLVLLGMAPYNTADNPWTLTSGLSIFYGGFSRGAWALSLLWVVFACQKGFGGPVNTFLGHSCWLPLSRLSYSLFLITVPVQLLSAGSTFLPMYMNHLNKFIETCGYLFVGGLVALGIAITIEFPVLALEKLILPRKGRDVQEEPIKES